MMSERTLTGKLILELLDEFPNAYSNTIAGVAFNRHPEVFNSKEHARGVVRYYRDAMGREARKHDGERRPREFDSSLWNPFDFPESDAEDFPPYDIPSGNNRVLILSDLHIPFHDIPALSLAVDEGVKRNVNAVLINGDLFDFHRGSRFLQDPRLKDMSAELDIGAEFLSKLHKALNCPIYLKLGNHDERWENYMKVRAPELLKTPEFQLNNLLNGRVDFTLNTIYRQVIYLGKLAVVHGHEYGGFGINNIAGPARGLFLKAKKSALMGHSHRESSFTTKNIEGSMITCWSTGCLCGLWPEYAQLNEWVHGFAIVEFDKEGWYSVDNYRINKGRLLK